MLPVRTLNPLARIHVETLVARRTYNLLYFLSLVCKKEGDVRMKEGFSLTSSHDARDAMIRGGGHFFFSSLIIKLCWGETILYYGGNLNFKRGLEVAHINTVCQQRMRQLSKTKRR